MGEGTRVVAPRMAAAVIGLVAALGIASTIAAESSPRPTIRTLTQRYTVESLRFISEPHTTPRSQEKPAIVVHGFENDLSGAHTRNPDVKLRVERDSEFADEPVLSVEYPMPSGDPAARDVQLDAANRNWSAGSAISFRIKPAHAIRVSVSFVDRNNVVYTAWRDLQGDAWQSVRIAFAEIRPNPYFQPPGAKTGAPLDVSDVSGIAFAPQDKTSGRLTISKVVVLR